MSKSNKSSLKLVASGQFQKEEGLYEFQLNIYIFESDQMVNIQKRMMLIAILHGMYTLQ